ncbi:MAG: ATP synthase F0 subunit B [Deltaproteobacteria bacterium]|jgi:F-type H+-transporting ATPase subunit b|nr:ATP synthase F0 subunit B [Deltaproteobacteria bacterium]
MRPIRQLVICSGYLISVTALLAVSCTDALAAEPTQNWRSVFDLVMRWLNFAIITLVLFKFGRKPIKDFLANRREEIDYQIKKFGQQKQAAEEKVLEATEMLNDSVARFEKIKQRIVEDGERKKQEIIEDARMESQMLLEATQRKIQNQINEAKNIIRSEIIDSAIALAEKRLPDEITAADEHKLIDHYMEMTAGK